MGARVRLLNRAVTRIYDDHLRPHGIKFSQMNILTTVSLREPIQPIEVARILSMEKSTLSRNVKVMEENDWLRSVAGETGNTRLLEMTREGRRALASAAPAWRAAQQQVISLLGERTAGAVRGAADRLRSPESS